MLSSCEKSEEPRHEPEIAMARLLMDTTLGDPGYGQRYSVQKPETALKFTTRSLIAITTLSSILCLLLTNVQGQILNDGVAFFAPIILCGYLTWQFYSRPRNSSMLRSFITGAIGGLFGNLVWPTGLLIVLVLLGKADYIAAPGAIILACAAISFTVGGAMSAILTVGFPPPKDSLQSGV